MTMTEDPRGTLRQLFAINDLVVMRQSSKKGIGIIVGTESDYMGILYSVLFCDGITRGINEIHLEKPPEAP